MALSKQTVEYVAHLSRIELTEEELEKLSKQLESIIGFIDALRAADVAGVRPTDHILPLNNALRPDEPRPSLPIEKTLANAPRKDGRFFAVPKVIE
ncbi:MAG TPA: Asp-tRNA(Asn)/Glu-tRNA(Gln) amidotransferase subunit GatC [Candidatus Omnitrophota bacterium]|nr:Asp-tRNA(Asn)/Glu-tRNA(Gln) amidotransferase subunit GatC [Candidatus Omnitrophota bacterium]MDD4940458.1 Asp-tRNA(Asn)/Glu-tRNA(Gln) amidotransferase subunit GatC [Candidatus Omnitrophota bacterium]HNQ51008.1 Asp-tRNA(Asn)/Glu-tRNA(Gln) amidotransferase subunit GatC [Candidatus Omnitrophota bacterium]HQO38676.1 Asp-tRNA(Asn)/Glu-tRNA(Gln) amidotransferase subunit GatC [Candidatus Omnitrophota bacterium]HQQ06487.1 Asp-tRNA(Asn)/Glu-tRNA(Gln) amidotransferase subunit GatC [Candidatus Omnitrop